MASGFAVCMTDPGVRHAPHIDTPTLTEARNYRMRQSVRDRASPEFRIDRSPRMPTMVKRTLAAHNASTGPPISGQISGRKAFTKAGIARIPIPTRDVIVPLSDLDHFAGLKSRRECKRLAHERTLHMDTDRK